MSVQGGNILLGVVDAEAAAAGEDTAEMLRQPNVRIERIISQAQASPPDFWFDQEWGEWVLVLSGSAGVLIEGEAEARTLVEGDYLDIPAHTRHRVDWTDPEEPTVWLAVHYR